MYGYSIGLAGIFADILSRNGKKNTILETCTEIMFPVDTHSS